MPEITLDAADGSGSFACHVVMPSANPAPAVVVIQEIFGVNANMRAICDWVASMGFIAIAPDLFWRQEPGVQLDPDAGQAQWERAFALMKALDQDKALQDVQTAINHARGMAGSTGKVGTMGFCLGGRMAFKAAIGTDSDANVSYYGVGLEGLVGAPLRGPVLVHIAEKDHFVPDAAKAAIQAALEGERDATVMVHPGVDHAFARIGGKAYDGRAATIAGGRSAEFLVKHLA